MNDNADFKICTEGAGEGHPEVQIIGPNGIKVPCKLQKVNGSILNKYDLILFLLSG